MALTLLEAKKQATNPQQIAIINEFLESDLLRVMPFKNVIGSGEIYNKVDKLPGIGFRGFNEAHEESVGVLNPQSEALKLFGGDLDVDKAIVDMEGPQARASHIQLKVQAARQKIERNVIKGDESNNAREFDGLQRRITGNQLVPNVDAGGPLSLNKLDKALHRVRAGSGPKYLIMNLSMKDRLAQAARNSSVGGHVNYRPDELGREQMFYQGARIIPLEDDNEGNEILPFTESSPDGGTQASTSIYVVRFGDLLTTGLQGRTSQGFGIQVKDLGEINEKPVLRVRLDWYVAMAVKNGRSVSRLYGITDAAPTV